MHMAAVTGVIICACALTIWSQNPVVPVSQQKSAEKKNAQKPKRNTVKTDSASALSGIMLADSLRRAADSLRRDSLLHMLFSFKVITDPDSAAVLLDDSARGASPCILSSVASGPHVLLLKKKGYYLKRAEISIDSASPREFSFVLLKPSFLHIVSDPSGATLSIDGKREGITPYENDKVKPGDHVLMLEMKKYVTVEKSISVKSGGNDTLRLTFEHTAAYKDSVAAAQQSAEKLRKEKSIFAVVSAVFCLCAIVLILFEANRQ